MHDHAFWKCIAVHARDVALRIVIAHQAANFLDTRESGVDPTLHVGSVPSRGYDFYKRAQQWPAATNFSV
jgi:hypothetical protein